MKRPRIKTIEEKIVERYKQLRGMDTRTAWFTINLKYSEAQWQQ